MYIRIYLYSKTKFAGNVLSMNGCAPTPLYLFTSIIVKNTFTFLAILLLYIRTYFCDHSQYSCKLYVVLDVNFDFKGKQSNEPERPLCLFS